MDVKEVKEIINEVVKGVTEQIKEGAEMARKEAETDKAKMIKSTE